MLLNEKRPPREGGRAAQRGFVRLAGLNSQDRARTRPSQAGGGVIRRARRRRLFSKVMLGGTISFSRESVKVTDKLYDRNRILEDDLHVCADTKYLFVDTHSVEKSGRPNNTRTGLRGGGNMVI